MPASLLTASVVVSAFVVFGFRRIALLALRAVSWILLAATVSLGLAVVLETWRRMKRRQLGHARARRGWVQLRFATTTGQAQASQFVRNELDTQYRRNSLHHRIHGRATHALNGVIDKILRDFVLKWFDDIVPAQYSDDDDTYSNCGFPVAIDQIIRHALQVAFERLEYMDLSHLVVARILPMITTHLRAFSEAEKDFSAARNAPGTTSEEVDLLLAQRYAEIRGVPLHSAVNVTMLNSQTSEQAHLRRLFDQVLPLLLPRREIASEAVRILSREIVACAVMTPVIETLSDPDFYNRIIEEKAGTALKEQQMVEQLREALEKQAAMAPSAGKRSQPAESLSPTSTSKDFERFTRSVNRSTLFDARRTRNDVDSQIRKVKLRLGQMSTTDEAAMGTSASQADLRNFMRRLLQLRDTLDHRITDLGGGASSRVTVGSQYSASIGRAPSGADAIAALEAILRDRESAGLSFFTEFLDRRHRMHMLQFWLAVEGLKDPLEHLGDPMGRAVNPIASEANAKTLKGDLLSISEIYFSDTKDVTALGLNRSEVASFLDLVRETTEETSIAQMRTAQRNLFSMQQQIFDSLLVNDFPVFATGDLYTKAMASLPQRAISGPSPIKLSPTSGIVKSSTSKNTKKPMSPTFASRKTDVALPDPANDSDLFGSVTGRITAALRPGLPFRSLTSPPESSTTNEILPTAMTAQTLSQKTGRQMVSASLEFLMSPGTEDRAPLFDVDELHARRISRDLEPELDDDTAKILQDALTTIISSANEASPQVPDAPQFAPLDSHDVHAQDAPKRLPRKAADNASTSSLPSTGRKSLFDDFNEAHEIQGFTINPASLVDNTQPQTSLGKEEAEVKISSLERQLSLATEMLSQADLTGDKARMRLISKSIASYQREIDFIQFETSQRNEIAPTLIHGRTQVSITGTSVGESNGQQFVLYMIEVHKLADDGTFASGWIVPRRYSEFYTLFGHLKEKHPLVRRVEFPTKKIVTWTSTQVVTHRKVTLDRFLKSIVKDAGCCSSPELMNFLSSSIVTLPSVDPFSELRRQVEMIPGHGLLRSMVKSMTTGLDGLAGLSLVDGLMTSLRQQALDFTGAALGGGGLNPEDILSSPTPNSLDLSDQASSSFAANRRVLLDADVTAFTAPICDLLIEVFELNDSHQWIRKQGIIVILQQILGGTIERKLREGLSEQLQEDQLTQLISTFEAILWPDGQLKPPSIPRTAEEKASTRDTAYRRLTALLPDMAASLLGRSNARRGARKAFALLQNRRLNRHLIYSIIDEVMFSIFPEIDL